MRAIADQRSARNHRRLLDLQAKFARHGFALDELTGAKLLVQRWSLYRVLDDLNAAERFLEDLGYAA